MTTIAQAYLHARTNGTDAELAEWGRQAEVLAFEIASSVFPMAVELEISFEVGSLISRAVVKNIGAALLATYGMVATYPQFKEGLLEAIADARVFSESFNDKFMSDAGIKPKDIVARQRRIETPGRIYRALERLENLEQSSSANRSPRYIQEQKHAVNQLHRGLSDLEISDRQQAVQLIVEHHAPRLPEPLLPQLMRPLLWRPEDETMVLVNHAVDHTDIKFLSKLSTAEPSGSRLLLEDRKKKKRKQQG